MIINNPPPAPLTPPFLRTYREIKVVWPSTGHARAPPALLTTPTHPSTHSPPVPHHLRGTRVGGTRPYRTGTGSGTGTGTGDRPARRRLARSVLQLPY